MLFNAGHAIIFKDQATSAVIVTLSSCSVCNVPQPPVAVANLAVALPKASTWSSGGGPTLETISTPRNMLVEKKNIRRIPISPLKGKVPLVILELDSIILAGIIVIRIIQGSACTGQNDTLAVRCEGDALVDVLEGEVDV